MRRSRAITAAAATAIAAALLLSGCSFASGGPSAGGRLGGSSVEMQPYAPGDQQSLPVPDQLGGGSASSESGDAASGRNSTSVAPQLITTGWLTLTDVDPIAVAAKVAAAVTEAGGRVDSRSESPATPDQSAQATITVRIPKTDFEQVLAKLKDLATVNAFEISAVDVTAQTLDLDARISALQESVERLRALMGSAATTADLLAAETSLSERQAELDSLIAQRDALRDQVEYSSVTVGIYSPGDVETSGPDDFWGGIAAGWNALLRTAGSSVVVVGFLLPWAVVFLLIAAVVIIVVRIASRRPRQQRPQSGQGGTGTGTNGFGAPYGGPGAPYAGPAAPHAAQQAPQQAAPHAPQQATPPAAGSALGETAPASPDDNAGPR